MSLLEGDSLFARIQENIADQAPQLIYADWLEENDREAEALSWRGQLKNLSTLFDWYGEGHGNGVNEGYVYGYGDGDGYSRGDSTGCGDGCGNGHGDGREEGYGDGHDHGLGYSAGYGTGLGYMQEPSIRYCAELSQFTENNKSIVEGKIMIGQNMLIWAGRGFAWVGKVEEMYINGGYKLSNAGMLCRTGGDAWTHVASGQARDRYVYRHAPKGIVYTAAPISGAILWEGDLPGEDKN